MHVHSIFSFDGLMRIDKLIKICIKKGLRGVSITDHDTLRGSSEALRIAKDYENFLVIPGEEISTNYGDILAYFVQEEIKAADVYEVIDKIKEQDGLSIIAHPYECLDRYPVDLLSKIDGVELFNSRSLFARSLPDELNNLLKKAKEHNWILTAGSDAHLYCEIGRAYIKSDEDISELEEMRHAIEKKRIRIFGVPTPPFVKIISQLVGCFRAKRWCSLLYYIIPRKFSIR